MTPAKPAPTRLGRPAEGLARYYLDCGWWRHPSFDDLSAEALIVWQAAVSYSHEHLTDGVLPANVDTLSLKLGLRVAWVRKARKQLLDTGRWALNDAGGLVIVGYLDHNPGKAEVQAWTQERSQRGTLGNHRRWHEARGVIDPDCVHCRKSDRNGDRSSDRSSDSVGDRKGDRMGWDGMGTIPPNPPSRPATEQPDTNGGTPPTTTPIDTPDGEYIPLPLPDVGHGLTVEHLWPEMARRVWHQRRVAGHRVPASGPRLQGWLATTATERQGIHGTYAATVLADTQPGRSADYVIWTLDPALALRDHAVPDGLPPPIEPVHLDPEQTRAAADIARRRLRSIPDPDTGDTPA